MRVDANDQTLFDLLKETEDPSRTGENPDAFLFQPGGENPQSVRPGEELLDFGDSLKIENFQVVRKEFFAHLLEPTISFCDCKLTANMACLYKFPEAEYVQFLVDGERKLLALRPCAEGARDSFRWCNISKGRRKPRDAKGIFFFAMIVELMGWNPDYKYKVLGRLVRANGEYLLLFDLSSYQTFERVLKEGEKPKTSRKAAFRADWKDSFGLPFREHEKMTKISIFDGFAVISVADPNPKSKNAAETASGEQLTLNDTGAGGGAGNV